MDTGEVPIIVSNSCLVIAYSCLPLPPTASERSVSSPRADWLFTVPSLMVRMAAVSSTERSQ